MICNLVAKYETINFFGYILEIQNMYSIVYVQFFKRFKYPSFNKPPPSSPSPRFT